MISNKLEFHIVKHLKISILIIYNGTHNIHIFMASS